MLFQKKITKFIQTIFALCKQAAFAEQRWAFRG